MTLLPSLPAKSFVEITTLTSALSGVVSEIQIDIVDGAFVPLTAWPFTEPEPLAELHKLQDTAAHFELEIDCMVHNPEQYFAVFKIIKPRRVIIHLGSTADHAAIQTVAATAGWKLGLAFTNDADMELVETLLPHYEYVQVMGIAEVGQQGQPFDEHTLDTVRMLREKHPDLEIAVDGSVNAATIPALKAAGVDRFAPGSAIAKQPDPRAAYVALKQLLEQS